MLINIPYQEILKFLETNEDCEALSGGEYVADLYDFECPITVNIRLENGKAEVLAAAKLLFDEEQDGWYMGERIEDEALIEKAFRFAMEG